MAKLYWRVKKRGKWTWIPAVWDLHLNQVDHPDGELVTLWWPSPEELGDDNESELEIIESE